MRKGFALYVALPGSMWAPLFAHPLPVLLGFARHVVLRDFACLDERGLEVPCDRVVGVVEVVVGVEDGIGQRGLEHGLFLRTGVRSNYERSGNFSVIGGITSMSSSMRLTT